MSAPYNDVLTALETADRMLTPGEIAAMAKQSPTVVKNVLRGLSAKGQIEVIPAQKGSEARYGLVTTKSSPEEPSPAKETGPTPQELHDSMLLGVIADIRKAIGDTKGKIQLGDLSEHISHICELGEAHKQAVMTWECSMMDAIGEDGVGSVTKAIENLKSELVTERQARQALQEQIDADPGVDIKDAAVGYVMLASKRKPRRIRNPESARESALGAIRAGAQRAEVFALVPVGKAVRGAQWREA